MTSLMHELTIVQSHRVFLCEKYWSAKLKKLFPHGFQWRFSTKEIKARLNFLLDILNHYPVELSVNFCDDAEMRDLNLSFRKQDKPTDVLSFYSGLEGIAQRLRLAADCQISSKTLSKKKNSQPVLRFPLGDIAVSIPYCLNQSLTYQNSLNQELEKMLIHAVVHLVGFDHERSTSAKKVQFSLEKKLKDELVLNFGVPDWGELKPIISQKKGARNSHD